MVPILTVIILVITALFGAVMFARLRHPHKESDPFECGLKPFSNEKDEVKINFNQAILFICLEAFIVVIIMLHNQ